MTTQHNRNRLLNKLILFYALLALILTGNLSKVQAQTSNEPLDVNVHLEDKCYTQEGGFLKYIKFINNMVLYNHFGNPATQYAYLVVKVKNPNTGNYISEVSLQYDQNNQAYANVSSLQIPYMGPNFSYDIYVYHKYFAGYPASGRWDPPTTVSVECTGECDPKFEASLTCNNLGKCYLCFWPIGIKSKGDFSVRLGSNTLYYGPQACIDVTPYVEEPGIICFDIEYEAEGENSEGQPCETTQTICEQGGE